MAALKGLPRWRNRGGKLLVSAMAVADCQGTGVTNPWSVLDRVDDGWLSCGPSLNSAVRVTVYRLGLPVQFNGLSWP